MSNFKNAFERSLEYFNGDELAANVFVTKYALTDRSGNVLETSPDDMHRRLAFKARKLQAN